MARLILIQIHPERLKKSHFGTVDPHKKNIAIMKNPTKKKAWKISYALMKKKKYSKRHASKAIIWSFPSYYTLHFVKMTKKKKKQFCS